MDTKNLTFEQKMDLLNDITDKINAGNLSLEETMKIYQDGKHLIQELKEELQKDEEKITKVVD